MRDALSKIHHQRTQQLPSEPPILLHIPLSKQSFQIPLDFDISRRSCVKAFQNWGEIARG
jgi:hypothetical protein